MQLIIANMTLAFNESKMSGSYFLLFLLSLFVLYSVNKEKNKWYLLYALEVILLVVANPVVILILSSVFPVLKTYTPFILLIPTLLYVPFAFVELLEEIKDNRLKKMVMIFMVVVIAISGNIFGFYQKNDISNKKLTNEQERIILLIDEMESPVVLADEDLAPFMRYFSDDITLLYGKDLWTPNMDLGIMDEYGEEMMPIYDAMKNPEKCMEDIAKVGVLYECDIIVVKNFSGHKAFVGSYQLELKTDHYLVYKLK